MEIFLWITIILLFILSFIGVLFPIIPSVLVLWVSFFLYHFGINGDSLGVIFWSIMGALTVILFVADIIANSYLVKKFGGSKWGERGAAIAVIIGCFITPPFGIIYVPFVTVFLIELQQNRTWKEALTASVGSFLGFLGGVFAKVIVQFFMIVSFVITIIFF